VVTAASKLIDKDTILKVPGTEVLGRQCQMFPVRHVPGDDLVRSGKPGRLLQTVTAITV